MPAEKLASRNDPRPPTFGLRTARRVPPLDAHNNTRRVPKRVGLIFFVTQDEIGDGPYAS